MKTFIIKKLRDKLGITQAEMANILGISSKAVQSYEQGWRKIPQHIEKMVLLITASLVGKKQKACWKILNCPKEIRKECIVYKTKLGHCCWAITDTTCHNNKKFKTWSEKKQACLSCPVLIEHFKVIF